MKNTFNTVILKLFLTSVLLLQAFYAKAVVNCDQLELNKLGSNVTKITSALYPQNQNLYKFNFKFSVECGFSSSQILFPQKTIVEALINRFYGSNIYTPIDKKIIGMEEHFTFNTRNKIFGGAVSYEAKHLLRYDTKYIHMQNSMEFSSPVLNTYGEFIGLKNIAWYDNCQQESAGWCLVWDGAFEITWELNGTDYQFFENKIKNEIAPKIFKETYLKYAQFVENTAQ